MSSRSYPSELATAVREYMTQSKRLSPKARLDFIRLRVLPAADRCIIWGEESAVNTYRSNSKVRNTVLSSTKSLQLLQDRLLLALIHSDSDEADRITRSMRQIRWTPITAEEEAIIDDWQKKDAIQRGQYYDDSDDTLEGGPDVQNQLPPRSDDPD